LAVNDSHPVTVWPKSQRVFGRAKPETVRTRSEVVRTDSTKSKA